MSKEPLLFVPGIAGVDEAGRGPLAGPVVTAAVVLPEGFDVSELDDSKKLAPKVRERLALIIQERADYCIVAVQPDEIDRLNILRATLEGMRRALCGLCSRPDSAWIDGNFAPPNPPCPCIPVVKGDRTYAAVAAASILAKTHRDALMLELAGHHPEYGFDRHFGYPTPEHLEALRLHGPTVHHRRSFAPVRELEEQPCLAFVE